MKKPGKAIAVLAALMILFCLVCRFTVGRTYYAWLPVRGPEEDWQDFRLEAEEPGVLETRQPQLYGRYLRVPIRPDGPGRTMLHATDPEGEHSAVGFFRVDRLGTVYDLSTGGFNGDWAVLIAFTLFCLATSALLLRAYRSAKGAAFYAYSTIYYAGFSLFALITGLAMASVTVRHLVRPWDYPMLSAYRTISSAGTHFLWITLPCLMVFCVALAVSNVELLRHERFRPQNVLGILAALLLMLGAGFGVWLTGRSFAGSEWEYRVRNTVECVYTTSYVYFECMLIGAILCGLRAARHQVGGDRDFIIILGCRFRRDGTLPPLLRGRVDRALEFWRKTGEKARFIPSGGQGPDETMPEAQAMRRYLLEQGVPDDAILPEEQSRNTYENMAFSRRLIEETGGGRAVYATTNYHVFRSGVWASLAGLPAEGIGSKTKWWFWPNAFMRECAGLLKNRWKQELALLVLMVGFFGLLSMFLY